MKVSIKENSMFKKLASNIQKNTDKLFDITNFINEEFINLNIKKIYIEKQKDYLFLNKDIDIKNFGNLDDLSLIEWNNNKIYLGFSEIFFEPAFILGKQIFNMYIHKISNLINKEKFIVSMSIDYGEYKNISIRFYKVRENDIPLINDDLEQYKLNGLMVGYIN